MDAPPENPGFVSGRSPSYAGTEGTSTVIDEDIVSQVEYMMESPTVPISVDVGTKDRMVEVTLYVAGLVELDGLVEFDRPVDDTVTLLTSPVEVLAVDVGEVVGVDVELVAAEEVEALVEAVLAVDDKVPIEALMEVVLLVDDEVPVEDVMLPVDVALVDVEAVTVDENVSVDDNRDSEAAPSKLETVLLRDVVEPTLVKDPVLLNTTVLSRPGILCAVLNAIVVLGLVVERFPSRVETLLVAISTSWQWLAKVPVQEVTTIVLVKSTGLCPVAYGRLSGYTVVVVNVAAPGIFDGESVEAVLMLFKVPILGRVRGSQVDVDDVVPYISSSYTGL